MSLSATLPLARRGFGILLAGAALILALAVLVPALLGFQRYVITSGSMTGTYDRGSLVFDQRRADLEPARRRRHHLPPARARRPRHAPHPHADLGRRQARAAPPRATPTASPTPGARSTLGDAQPGARGLPPSLPRLRPRRRSASQGAHARHRRSPRCSSPWARWPACGATPPRKARPHSRHDPGRRHCSPPSWRPPLRCRARRRRSPPSATNAGASFATAANFPPAVTLTTPATGSTTNDTTPTLSGAAGNSTGDNTPINVEDLQRTRPPPARSCRRSTRNRTSATLDVDADHCAGPGHLHRPGHADRHRRATPARAAANTFTVDTTEAHRASGSSATNKTGGTAGKIENGDTLTFTYSEPITAASVWSGWSGSEHAGQREVHQRGTTDTFTVADSHHGHRSSSAASRPTATTSAPPRPSPRRWCARPTAPRSSSPSARPPAWWPPPSRPRT